MAKKTSLRKRVPPISLATNGRKKGGGGKSAHAALAHRNTPAFPYTTRPSSLRKTLKLISEKPKPQKFNRETLKSWGMKSGEDVTVVRVLRDLDLIDASGSPTGNYEEYMHPVNGAEILGRRMRTAYNKLFEAHHLPCSEGEEVLKSFFNTFGGGSEQVVRLQQQTFQALCEHASFKSDESPASHAPPGQTSAMSTNNSSDIQGSSSNTIGVHINLHIHLPENKSTRDYQAIIEDIGRYIYRNQDEPDET